MQFSTWYSIIVGMLMIAQWIFFLASGSVPEVHSAPIALTFQLAAELGTALCLILAGIALQRRAAWARGFALFAAGMLAYTVIVSPGYFAQHDQWPLVGMFAVLLVLDAVNVARLLSHK